MNYFYGIPEETIREYARLIVRTGVNVQPGQVVNVRCPAEQFRFAHFVIEEAYAAGAGEVIMRWSDSFDLKQFYLHASDEAISTVPAWKAESFNSYSRTGACYISIIGDDPESLKGVDPARMQTRETALRKALEEHNRLMMASAIPWTVAAVPQTSWAAKMFPELSEEAAMKRLWELILQSVRIDGNDAVTNWKEHDAFLKEKCRKLNDFSFAKLHYENRLGTDFTVGLAKGHIWEGGSEKAGTGTVFEANLPTEEVFTMPDRMKAEGTLVSALPLSCRGQLIRNFSLTFHEGKVVAFTAEEGFETLRSVIETDEGSCRLGECAIIPCSSPIAQMGQLFYDTLFDENASCHFALGACYPMNLKGGDDLSEEELSAAGGNDSAVHVDFMVGTPDLKITGIAEDGTQTVIFDRGDWVI